MSGVVLPAGLAVGHRAGSANYDGDRRSIVGEIKGPTYYDPPQLVVAVDATYDATADRTRVEFCYVTDTDGAS